MNTLLSVLLAAACISPAFAADAPKPADAKAAQATEQMVTPQSQAEALKAAIADKKNAAKAAKGEKPVEAKK